MKRNYTVIFAAALALIVLCAFWGCDSSDDDDGPSLPHAEEASLGTGEITLATGEQVYEADGATHYSPSNTGKTIRTHNDIGSSYVPLVSAASSISDSGILTLKLPAYSYWAESDNGGRIEEEGLTADPPDVLTVHIWDFVVESSSDAFYRAVVEKRKGTDSVTYLCANKDARIWGEVEDDGIRFSVNLILKQGWNSVIVSDSGSRTIVSGSPGSGYRWIAEEED
ncbi:MAG: hypothetical protein LBK13_01035 [Spirochaetales bacterium]|jgi:hypothetical protein|nr:hypothetical protein [Spirochaetales bacterium]